MKEVSIFDKIKWITPKNSEAWYARDLQNLLEYAEWRNFKKVVDKAKEACFNSGYDVSMNFFDCKKKIKTGVSEREIDDVVLSRYACYLIIQNSDPAKEVVSLGQTYFAQQTRKQELFEEFNLLSEDKKRVSIREELKEHNKSLAEAASNAGIKEGPEYAEFQNYGYKGLYGGMTARDIHEKKNLSSNQKILDHMGSAELAANLFRATQTDEKLRRDNVKSRDEANKTHYNVGKKVRDTISEIGGQMPEDLPTPDNIKDAKLRIKEKEDVKKIK